ncbi:TadE/TadG family type IV pilus assembly protein [Janibacter terrae]|nr:TadE/TadG family type IV pilus assembly protein [Janibacter terrae]
MARTGHSRPAWRQRGAAAVEMALVLPLLFLMIAGIVDFGRYFLTEIQLTNAVREGARVAVLGESQPNIVLRTEKAAGVVQGLAVTTPQLCTAGVGGDAEVVATGTFEWILLDPAMSLFGASGTLPPARAKAVMRCGG